MAWTSMPSNKGRFFGVFNLAFWFLLIQPVPVKLTVLDKLYLPDTNSTSMVHVCHSLNG